MLPAFYPLLVLVGWESRILRTLRQLESRRLALIEQGNAEQYDLLRAELLQELETCRGCAYYQAKVAA